VVGKGFPVHTPSILHGAQVGASSFWHLLVSMTP
jgi:hypothetical protein